MTRLSAILEENAVLSSSSWTKFELQATSERRALEMFVPDCLNFDHSLRPHLRVHSSSPAHHVLYFFPSQSVLGFFTVFS